MENTKTNKNNRFNGLLKNKCEAEKSFAKLNFICALILYTGSLAVVLFFKFTVKDLSLIRFKTIFEDFARTLSFALSKDPFVPTADFSTSYMPFAILLIKPFALICSKFAGQNYAAINYTWQFYISYSLFLAVCTASIYFLFKKITGVTRRSSLINFASFFFSGLFIFTFIRGNIIFLSLIFTLLFLAFKDSKNKLIREISLMSLAAAGVIKIYPLFFGVLLLKEKKFFQSFRVAVYFILLFFLPFLCFEKTPFNPSSWLVFKEYLSNVYLFGYLENRALSVVNLSSSALITKLFYMTDFIFKTDTVKIASLLEKIFALIIIMAGTFATVKEKDKLKTYALIVTVMIAVPSVSYFYCLIFLLVPFIEFIREYDNIEEKSRRIYAITAVISFNAFLVITIIYFVYGIFFLAFIGYETVKAVKSMQSVKARIV